MKQYKNAMFIEFNLIFLFYVMGDVITTWIGLRMGHVERNNLMAIILNYEYGILYLLVIKILFFVWLLYVISKKGQSKIIRYTIFCIMCFGIFITLSNCLVIFTGYNLFQLLGLM